MKDPVWKQLGLEIPSIAEAYRLFIANSLQGRHGKLRRP